MFPKHKPQSSQLRQDTGLDCPPDHTGENSTMEAWPLGNRGSPRPQHPHMGPLVLRHPGGSLQISPPVDTRSSVGALWDRDRASRPCHRSPLSLRARDATVLPHGRCSPVAWAPTAVEGSKADPGGRLVYQDLLQCLECGIFGVEQKGTTDRKVSLDCRPSEASSRPGIEYSKRH